MNYRQRFIAEMIVLAILMLSVSIAIRANYYSQIVTWGLFSYIIAKEVVEYLREVEQRRHLYKWPMTLYFPKHKIKGGIMSFQLHTDEVLPIRLGKPVDSTGAEAEIEAGMLVIESSDTSVFTIEQDPDFPDDPYAFLVVSQAEGTATLKAKADADLGEGVQEITLEVEGEILAAGAVGFAPFQFGTPRKKTQPGE